YELDLCAPEVNPNNVAGDLDYVATGLLTVQGNGATIEQTCPGERLFEVHSSPVVLEDLRLTGGDADGAVVRFSGDLTLDGIEAFGNHGEELLEGNIAPGQDHEILDSTFVAEPDNERALYSSDAESVEVHGSSFRGFGSQAVHSGESGAPVWITDSTFVGNGHVDPGVGGAVSANGPIDVSGSSFVDNVGANGSALRSGDGGIDADTSTFVGNQLEGSIGGALYSIDLNANPADNTVELSHVTLWDNTEADGDPANVESAGPLTSF
ncbi:hypothetical protein B7486_66255, partial [cyanobacterium TDX16]